MTIRRRHRILMAAAKRNSERRARSAILVVFFLGLFVAMLLLEMFFVDDYRDDSLLAKLGLSGGKEVDIVLVPQVVQELARIMPNLANGTDIEDLSTSIDGPDTWQPVRGTKDRFYVYSAYYDDRRGQYVRIIAAARTRLADKVMCQFWYRSGKAPVAVYAANRLIRENWNLKYSAYFLLCPFPNDMWQTPDAVSIIKPGDTAVSNRLMIHKPKKSFFSSPKGIAVCVKPLHYNYNKVINMVEFIELNRILGVDHFYFYNHTIGSQVNCIVKKYIEEGVITLLPWQLNLVSQREIRTEGLFASINDCLYRTMYNYQYVLMIDLDEYIIPNRNNSLPIMLGQLMRKNSGRTGAFSFQNAFFYLQWPSDTESKTLPYPLVTLMKTKRKAKYHLHKQRSKCIVLPDRVVEMGNHFVWEFVPGKIMFNIPPDIAYLHHYRVCEFGGNDCINTSYVTDRRAYKWKNEMIKEVSSRLKNLENECNLKDFVS